MSYYRSFQLLTGYCSVRAGASAKVLGQSGKIDFSLDGQTMQVFIPLKTNPKHILFDVLHPIITSVVLGRLQ